MAPQFEILRTARAANDEVGRRETAAQLVYGIAALRGRGLVNVVDGLSIAFRRVHDCPDTGDKAGQMSRWIVLRYLNRQDNPLTPGTSAVLARARESGELAQIALVCYGTATVGDWKLNVSVGGKSVAWSSGLVHGGFLTAIEKTLRDDVDYPGDGIMNGGSSVYNVLQRAAVAKGYSIGTDTQIGCYGHSLGGAMASIAAYALSYSGYSPRLITFGAPGAFRTVRSLIPSARHYRLKFVVSLITERLARTYYDPVTLVCEPVNYYMGEYQDCVIKFSGMDYVDRLMHPVETLSTAGHVMSLYLVAIGIPNILFISS